MHKYTYSWYSERLNQEMPIAVYGHYGLPLLMFPTASADFLEYERFKLIAAMGDLINSGQVKIYSIDSINKEAWGNRRMHSHDKAVRSQQFMEYVANEVVPYIYTTCGGGEQPIITSGASMGAFYAANALFKYPEVITGMVGMHGVYDISPYCGDYFDDDCYFSSPVSYLANLNDDYYLPRLRAKQHIHILTSRGMWENPQHSIDLSNVLKSRGIPHNLDIWGHDIPHDWPAWFKMLSFYMSYIHDSL